MTGPGPATPSARPTGITILAVLSAIGGILTLLGGVALIGVGSLAAAGTGTAAYFGLGAVFGILLLASGIASLVFAYGAWNLRPWAWTLGVALQVLGLVLAVVTILGGADITSQIIGIVINAIILYYLFQPNIKSAFGKA